LASWLSDSAKDSGSIELYVCMAFGENMFDINTDASDNARKDVLFGRYEMMYNFYSADAQSIVMMNSNILDNSRGRGH